MSLVTNATRTPISPARSVRGVGAAPALTRAETDMMQRHIDDITPHVAKYAQAMLLLDRADRYIAVDRKWPRDMTPILLP